MKIFGRRVSVFSMGDPEADQQTEPQMTSIDDRLRLIENSELLTPEEVEEERQRAVEMARMQGQLQKRQEEADNRRCALAQRMENLTSRWGGLEERRRARIQFYHAKIQYEQQLNTSAPPASP